MRSDSAVTTPIILPLPSSTGKVSCQLARAMRGNISLAGVPGSKLTKGRSAIMTSRTKTSRSTSRLVDGCAGDSRWPGTCEP